MVMSHLKKHLKIMEEEEKDLNTEEETSEDSGQVEEEKNDTELDESEEEEQVTISKSELEKLRKDKENYRNGLLGLKRKGRTLPGAESDDKDISQEEEDEFEKKLKSEFVSKKDYQKSIEDAAIKEASKDSEIDENWESILEYYIPRQGKNSVESILIDIRRAHKAWKVDNPSPEEKEKPEDNDKKLKADLSKDKGLSKGKEKSPQPKKKSILLGHEEKMTDWYGPQPKK